MRRRGIGAGVAALVGLTGLGFAAVPAQADANFSFTRPANTADRFATAASVATAAFPTGASDVIIANGDNAVDALAASYLSGGTIPILYTQANALPQATLDAWTTLKPTKTWVVGGTTAVSDTVYNAITGTKQRITGADRYETAVNIAKQKAGTTAPTTAFIARGDQFADALAIAPVAAKLGIPVLLTETASLNATTAAALATWGIKNVTVIGGASAVSENVRTQLTAAGVASTRVEGATRTSTATAIANNAAYGFAKTGVYLVNGFSPVDALPAAVAAAKVNAPIILTDGATLGADAQGYLTSNANTLTSGVAVGGTTVLPETVLDAGEDAAQTVTSVTITAVNAGANQFTFADPATKAPVTVTYATTDQFTVGGTSSSLGVFEAALSAGDTIVISSNTPSAGVTTYALTNVAAATYTSGLVGTGSTAAAVNIAEPVTGATVNQVTIAGLTDPLYQLNGAASTATAFAAAINPGDQITFTGTADADVQDVVNLVNTTVTGKVTAKTSTTVTFQTASGALITTGTLTGGDTLTSDGEESADLAAFLADVSVGDTISYSRNNGEATVALTNAAATPVTGVAVQGADPTALVVYSGSSTTAAPAAPFDTTGAGVTLTVDGAQVTAAEFAAALTPGDEVTITPPDGAIDTTGSAALTNRGLSGPVGGIVTGSDTLDVYTAAGVAGGVEVVDNINYRTNYFYAGNTSSTYFVNGTSQTADQFETALASVANGASTGSLQLVDNGAVTEWRLTTAAVTAAPTLVSASISVNAAGDDTVTLQFSKPVYYSAAPAPGDVTYGSASNAISAVSPTFAGTASNTITLTVAETLSAVPSPATTAFTLTAQGAAKIKDANGVSVAAATTVTASVVS
nr:cell wall-binding repeat-containing protein [Kineococcus vitellinus]